MKTLALIAALLWVAPALADQQPDPRPIQWQNCALGGASGGASQIATGGTAVKLSVGSIPPGPALRGLYVENPSTATESLFVGVTSTSASTTAGASIELQAGQSFNEGPGTIGNAAPSFNAASSGHAFTCVYGQ